MKDQVYVSICLMATRGEYGLTDKSFVTHHGRIGVETIGKGGKYRAEYAQQLLSERIDVWEKRRYADMTQQGRTAPHSGDFKGYLRLTGHKLNELRGEGYTTTIANFSGPIEIFQDVSQQLGHNRLDVLFTYLTH